MDAPTNFTTVWRRSKVGERQFTGVNIDTFISLSSTFGRIHFLPVAMITDELCHCLTFAKCQKQCQLWKQNILQHLNIEIYTSMSFKSGILTTSSKTCLLPAVFTNHLNTSPTSFVWSFVLEKWKKKIRLEPLHSWKHFQRVKSLPAVWVPPPFLFGRALFHLAKAACTWLFHLFRFYLRMVNGQNNVCSCFSSTMADVLPYSYKSFPLCHCRESFLLAAWIVKVNLAGH